MFVPLDPDLNALSVPMLRISWFLFSFREHMIPLVGTMHFNIEGIRLIRIAYLTEKAQSCMARRGGTRLRSLPLQMEQIHIHLRRHLHLSSMNALSDLFFLREESSNIAFLVRKGRCPRSIQHKWTACFSSLTSKGRTTEWMQQRRRSFG